MILIFFASSVCESFRVSFIYFVIILLYHSHISSHSENRIIKYHDVRSLHSLFSINAKK